MDQYLRELNNLGVYLLHQGDLQLAFRCLHDSLSLSLEMGFGPEHSNTPDQLRAACNYPYKEAFPPICMNAREITEAQVKRPSPTSTAFVHSHGMVIDEKSVLCYSSGTVRASIITSIILFNMGLVCHLAGIKENAIGSAKLMKAKSLYRKSSTILSEVGMPWSFSTGNHMIDLLLMALLNNIAQIDFTMSNYNESRAHLDELVRFSNSVLPGIHGYSDVGFFDLEFYRANFLLNATLLNLPMLAPAA